MSDGFIIFSFLVIVLGFSPLLTLFLGVCVWINIEQKKRKR